MKHKGDRLNALTDAQIDALAKAAVANRRAQLDRLSDDEALDLCRGIYQGMKNTFYANQNERRQLAREGATA